MNIRARLEAEHSKTLTLAIAKYVGDDKKRFKELMDVFFTGEYRLTQRAAWPLSFITIEHPQLLNPYFKKLIRILQQPGHHPAIHRNILRTFQDIDLREKYHGPLIDACFGFIMNEAVPLAIRAFAISTAARICTHYPELKNELLLVLNDLAQLPQAPAIRVRIKSALKVLKASDPKV